MSCVTVAQVLAVAPELATFGGPGSGTVTFAASTVPGDTITIGGQTYLVFRYAGAPPNFWAMRIA